VAKASGYGEEMMRDSGPYSKNRPEYLKFMASLTNQGYYNEPSYMHYFIYYLLKQNDRALFLSMNIDGFEEYFDVNINPKDFKNARILQLHGTLRQILCTKWHANPTTAQTIRDFAEGISAYCQTCVDGKKRKPGHVKPDIQLYGQGTRFYGHFAARERFLGEASIVLVLGTSLRSEDGLNHVRRWRSRKTALFIYIDRDPVLRPELTGLFDYHLVTDCDPFIKKVTEKINIDLESFAEPLHKSKIHQANTDFCELLMAKIEAIAPNDTDLHKCRSFLESL
jgi:NAD-dependent SIR2 family protein deacetylase